MKLSELTTDESLDALVVLTPYINSILIDQELVEELRRKIDPDRLKTKAETMLEGAARINTLVPIVLKKHRLDVYGILSVLNRKTPEEIGKQNFLVTAMQISDAVKDKALVDFFKSCAAQEETEPKEPSCPAPQGSDAAAT